MVAWLVNCRCLLCLLFQTSKNQIKVDLVDENFTELKGEIAGPPDTPYEGEVIFKRHCQLLGMMMIIINKKKNHFLDGKATSNGYFVKLLFFLAKAEIYGLFLGIAINHFSRFLIGRIKDN